MTETKSKTKTKVKAKTTTKKRPPGRQSLYTIAKGDQLCKLHSEGLTLTACCEKLGISRGTLYLWRKAHDDFNERLARARDIYCDVIADECLRIADNLEIGEIYEEGENDRGTFTKRQRRDMIEHRKLQVETRLKLLAKWSPEKYGDQKKVALTGENGGAIKIESSVDLTQSQKAVLDKVLDEEY